MIDVELGTSGQRRVGHLIFHVLAERHVGAVRLDCGGLCLAEAGDAPVDPAHMPLFPESLQGGTLGQNPEGRVVAYRFQ